MCHTTEETSWCEVGNRCGMLHQNSVLYPDIVYIAQGMNLISRSKCSVFPLVG